MMVLRSKRARAAWEREARRRISGSISLRNHANQMKGFLLIELASVIDTLDSSHSLSSPWARCLLCRPVVVAEALTLLTLLSEDASGVHPLSPAAHPS